MQVWHSGTTTVAARLREAVMPISALMDLVAQRHIARVPGTAVFLTRTEHDAPPVLLWHLKHNRSLHRQVFILSVETDPVPWVEDAQRLTVEEIAPQIWRARARFGFIERPDVPSLMARAHSGGCGIDLSDLTYFVGHETVVAKEGAGGLPKWVERVFAFLQRNSTHVTDYFRLPAETVVELGREVAI